MFTHVLQFYRTLCISRQIFFLLTNFKPVVFIPAEKKSKQKKNVVQKEFIDLRTFHIFWALSLVEISRVLSLFYVLELLYPSSTMKRKDFAIFFLKNVSKSVVIPNYQEAFLPNNLRHILFPFLNVRFFFFFSSEELHISVCHCSQMRSSKN